MAEPLAFEPLAQLRDVHVPEGVSWWPPAPGWWVVAIAAGLIIVHATRRLHRHLMSPAYTARRELKALQSSFAAGAKPQDTLVELASLLKRTAVACYPERTVAGLSGRPWLEFLDESGGTDAFTHGCGAALASAPYKRDASIDMPSLLSLGEQWLKHTQRQRGRRS